MTPEERQQVIDALKLALEYTDERGRPVFNYALAVMYAVSQRESNLWQAATAAERERCAKVCDGFEQSSRYQTQRNLAKWCAAAIRQG